MSFLELIGDGRNFQRVFGHRPAAWAAWLQLREAVSSSMDPRRYELATFAAARALGSSYCALQHGQILADEHLDADAVIRLASGERPAAVDEVEVAVMELAAAVARDSGAVTQAHVDRLRGLGLDDGEIFDVILAAAIRAFFVKAVDGAGVLPDASFNDLAPEFRAALTVGRPIAAE